MLGMALAERYDWTLAIQHHQSPRPTRCVWLLIAVKFAVEFLWNFLEGNSTLTKFCRKFAASFARCLAAHFAGKLRWQTLPQISPLSFAVNFRRARAVTAAQHLQPLQWQLFH